MRAPWHNRPNRRNRRHHPEPENTKQLLARCESLPPVPTAVAHPCEASALAGAVEAAKRGLIVPLLVGPAAAIAQTARAAEIDLGKLEIIDVPHSHAAATRPSS
jgi:phosphate acetyltransferase